MIPAGGITTASFIAYLVEKRYAKHPERFGRGAIEGVAAPESANNSAAISGFAPLLALGIPGSATTAVMLAGFMMWGIRPGPCFSRSTQTWCGDSSPVCMSAISCCCS